MGHPRNKVPDHAELTAIALYDRARNYEVRTKTIIETRRFYEAARTRSSLSRLAKFRGIPSCYPSRRERRPAHPARVEISELALQRLCRLISFHAIFLSLIPIHEIRPRAQPSLRMPRGSDRHGRESAVPPSFPPSRALYSAFFPSETFIRRGNNAFIFTAPLSRDLKSRGPTGASSRCVPSLRVRRGASGGGVQFINFRRNVRATAAAESRAERQRNDVIHQIKRSSPRRIMDIIHR